MPKFEGPHGPCRAEEGLISVAEAIEVEATTLGEAIAAYERATSTRIIPYDGRYPEYPLDPDDPKGFLYWGKGRHWEGTYVDLHIKRRGMVLCPRQDLRFPLERDDVVFVALRAC